MNKAIDDQRGKLYHGSMSSAALYISLVIATLAVSWAAILIRLAGADPIATAFYRMALAAALLAPFALPGFIKSIRKLSSSDLLRLVASGIVLGLHFALWISSLSYTTISNSVVLVATQPFFVAIVESCIWKERISRPAMLGMFFALVGMIIISGADFQLGGNHLYGDMLALGGAFCAGIYLLLGRKIRQNLCNRHYIFPVYAIAAITILIIAFAKQTPLTEFSGKVWLIFLVLALVPTIIGHSLYNFLLKFVRAQLVAITILGEPIGATIFAALIFAEYPNQPTYIGGIMILVGIFLALWRAKSDARYYESA